MAGEFLSTITFEHVSGLPADRITNTFAWNTTGAGETADFVLIRDALDTLYRDQDTNTNRVSDYMSPAVSRSVAPTVRIYDVSQNLNGLSLADGGIPSG